MPLTPLTLTTCLWHDGTAEAAATFYVSVFPNSRITHIQRYSAAGRETHGQEPGAVLVAEFVLDGHRFVALNGGPHHKTFTPAISFQIDCASQDEVDYYWEKLGEGGDPEHRQCGWVQDKFGMSWQVVPAVLKEMLASEDIEAAGRAMVAMMGMGKLDVGELRRAFDGEGGK
ncbi:Glyoxalase/Bleomycin resistance protein/Dihydroxybiphenyl dioxygenase [Lasiosphaeria hispida]|uniref:Glyoxalase/Bleomycin resistance protein/Dihydroxybiphenyl dioxygenase n=1 Tax=Lasiosphaeria hispida TaxID=260671 RepID=A0AAJ0H573_9PEZI|nr:Glyoxalase/Bleomycin resistance protein/Dihydroxybiphenyl dioxygenase [Lasiosphaeria hispida]